MPTDSEKIQELARQVDAMADRVEMLVERVSSVEQDIAVVRDRMAEGRVASEQRHVEILGAVRQSQEDLRSITDRLFKLVENRDNLAVGLHKEKTEAAGKEGANELAIAKSRIALLRQVVISGAGVLAAMAAGGGIMHQCMGSSATAQQSPIADESPAGEPEEQPELASEPLPAVP